MLTGVEVYEDYSVSGNNDFSSPIPEHRESQLVYARELMRMTADVGAKTMRVFLAWPGVTLLPEGGGRYDFAQTLWKAEHKDFSEEQTWTWCRESLEEAAKLADSMAGGRGHRSDRRKVAATSAGSDFCSVSVSHPWLSFRQWQ